MCGTSAVLHTKASSPPWHCPWFRGGAHLHLRGRDLRVLLFPPRLTPASGTISDTLNSRRALREEDGFQEEEERFAKRPKERERGEEKAPRFPRVKEKKARFFFRSCCRRTMAAKCLFFHRIHIHRLSVIFHEKRNVVAKPRL